MTHSRKITTSDTFSRLWMHECLRVFCDRLVTKEDINWLQSTAIDLCNRFMNIKLNPDEIFINTPVVFADFLKPEAETRFYEDCRDLSKLQTILEDLLDQYNATHATQLNLVFFTDALVHVCRIARILRQPRGHAMLIGVGGSGKQSLTRIAAYVCGADCRTLEIRRGYSIINFREDLRGMMEEAGVDGKEIVLLVTDSQVTNCN
jgi:dynein heavy chain